MCSGSISADVIKLPVLFTVCVKDIGSNGVSSYLGEIEAIVLHKFGPIILL